MLWLKKGNRYNGMPARPQHPEKLSCHFPGSASMLQHGHTENGVHTLVAQGDLVQIRHHMRAVADFHIQI